MTITPVARLTDTRCDDRAPGWTRGGPRVDHRRVRTPGGPHRRRCAARHRHLRSGAADQLGAFVDSYREDATQETTRIRALYVLIGESLASADPQRSATVTVGGLRRVVTELPMEPGLTGPEALAVELRRGPVSPLLAEGSREHR